MKKILKFNYPCIQFKLILCTICIYFLFPGKFLHLFDLRHLNQLELQVSPSPSPELNVSSFSKLRMDSDWPLVVSYVYENNIYQRLWLIVFLLNSYLPNNEEYYVICRIALFFVHIKKLFKTSQSTWVEFALKKH